MRRFSLYLSVIFAIGFSLYWFGDDLLDPIKGYVENQDVLTLEAKYGPESLMELHRRDLLSDHQKTYQDPQLKYYPYLLMEVKFVDSNKKPKEGVILWSQSDGEMVINTEAWEKTHGFEDAINADATAADFRVLNILAEKGVQTRDKLQKELNVDEEALNGMIDSVQKKQLVIVKGNEIQLHMENPKFFVTPQTKMTQWLVTKPFSQGKKVSPLYSKSRIERNAKAAFGSSFSIKNVKEIFLPVYSISVLNGDGSILISDWNAINGARIQPNYKVG